MPERQITQRLSAPNADAERLDIGQGSPTDLPHPGFVAADTSIAGSADIRKAIGADASQPSGLSSSTVIALFSCLVTSFDGGTRNGKAKQWEDCTAQSSMREKLQHAVPAYCRGGHALRCRGIRQRMVACHSRTLVISVSDARRAASMQTCNACLVAPRSAVAWHLLG